jgi:hypothetical protein
MVKRLAVVERIKRYVSGDIKRMNFRPQRVSLLFIKLFCALASIYPTPSPYMESTKHINEELLTSFFLALNFFATMKPGILLFVSYPRSCSLYEIYSEDWKAGEKDWNRDISK